MITKIKNKLSSFISDTNVGLRKLNQKIDHLSSEVASLKELVALQYVEKVKQAGIVDNLAEVEFKVYSQKGEDGIIQYLINNIDIKEKTFIEFGVENYREANTRFLLKHNNWSGLVMDGSEKNVQFIKQDPIYCEQELMAIPAFITRTNINELIAKAGFEGEIGILSVDIDGNDYWVWKAIDVVNPVIVICEYNSVFGNTRSVTIPYKEDFYLSKYHHSRLYFGASLPALLHLAEEKGYAFVGSNSNGSNAFFVRKDKVGALKIKDAETGYVASKFRSSRDEDGKLNHLSGNKRLEAVKGLPVINVLTGAEEVL